ncbi:MAG: MFS transporter [Anaerolineae bacterium]|nr:MFS transporter [Anaerolineae bacterium]
MLDSSHEGHSFSHPNLRPMSIENVRRAPAALAASLLAPGIEGDERHNYRNLLLNGTCFGPVDGGILTYLPVFMARLGASPSLLSLLTSGPSLIALLSYIPGGAYVERRSNLVRLVASSSIITRSSYLLIALLPFAFAPAYIPVAVVVLWSLAAVPTGVMMASWTTVMQKAVSPRLRAQLNGTRWGLMSVVSAIAMALFGNMLDRAPFPAGYQVVFAISFVANLGHIYFWLKIRVPPFVRDRSEPSQETGLTQRVQAFLRPFAQSRAFVRYNLATFGYRLALNMPAALFSIFWVKDLQATDTWIGLRGTAGYVALVVGYAFWGRMANRLGHRNLLIICGAGLGFYPMLTALAPSMQWLLPVAMVWGFTVAAIDIGFFDMLLAVCPEGRQPSFAAAANILSNVAALTGPLLGALLAQALSVRAALFVSGVLQVVCVVFFLLLPTREQEGLASS